MHCSFGSLVDCLRERFRGGRRGVDVDANVDWKAGVGVSLMTRENEGMIVELGR